MKEANNIEPCYTEEEQHVISEKSVMITEDTKSKKITKRGISGVHFIKHLEKDFNLSYRLVVNSKGKTILNRILNKNLTLQY